MTITNAGIEYTLPTVLLLQESGLGTSEYAGRTAYDSFDKSENSDIINLNRTVSDTNHIGSVRSDKLIEFYKNGCDINKTIIGINNIPHSDLLDSLAWVHHHHSVLEHCNLTYLIKGISRGVLQELVRHRIASYTVRSTRYTMQSILNAFIASYSNSQDRLIFRGLVPNFSVFSKDSVWFIYECEYVFSKLKQQLQVLGYEQFMELALSKDAHINGALEQTSSEAIFNALELSKPKRNVGDAFKHIVTDNWYTDLVMTMNLRSLKNFFELRDSGAAYFLIRELAKQMKLSTPDKYLNLIVKNN